MESIHGVHGRNCCCCANHILSKWCNISLIVRMHMAPKWNCMHAPHAASTLRFHGKDAVLQVGHAGCCPSFHSCLLCIHALMCRSRVQTKTSKNLLYVANCMIASVVLSLTWLQIRIPKVYVNKTFSIKLCNLFMSQFVGDFCETGVVTTGAAGSAHEGRYHPVIMSLQNLSQVLGSSQSVVHPTALLNKTPKVL
jgi:hypothetical protein